MIQGRNGQKGTRGLGSLGKILLLCLGFFFGAVGTGQAQTKADANKHANPRATVRSFLRSANLARESPKHIKAAIECLDLTAPGADQRNPGLLATYLEAILRSRDIDTDAIPEKVEGSVYMLPDSHNLHITLKRGADGRWLFDQETVAQIPKMYTEIQKQLQEKNKEAAALNITPELATPRATFRTFVKSLHRGDTETALKCLDLDEVPAVARAEVGLRVANKLKQIIYRHRLVVYQDIPDVNYSDPFLWLSQTEGVIELVRRASGEHKGEWVFSKATVRSIDELYAAFENKPYLPELSATRTAALQPNAWRAPELWLRGELPDLCKTELFTVLGIRVELYEAVGYPLLVVLALIVARLAAATLALVARPILRLRGFDLPRATLSRRLRWTGRFLALGALRWGVLFLAVHKTVLIVLLAVLNPLFLLLGLLAINGIIDLIGDLIETRHAAGKRSTGITQMLWPVGSLVIKITLLFFTIFRLMAIFSWDVSTLLAGLGIGGLAFALEYQDSLKNLFGSFTLIADRPFVVGETVRIGSEGTGKVEFVGLRSTRIRTADDTLLIVPNSNLTTMNIVNYGRRRFHHYQTKIGIAYDTPLPRLAAFRDGIRALIERQPWTRKDHCEVAIHDIDSSTVTILVDVYFEPSSQMGELDARDALLMAILQLAEQQRVRLAFPTHAVHLLPAAGHTQTAADETPKTTTAGYTTAELRASA